MAHCERKNRQACSLAPPGSRSTFSFFFLLLLFYANSRPPASSPLLVRGAPVCLTMSALHSLPGRPSSHYNLLITAVPLRERERDRERKRQRERERERGKALCLLIGCARWSSVAKGRVSLGDGWMWQLERATGLSDVYINLMSHLYAAAIVFNVTTLQIDVL